jgi:hypothetical protein
MNPNLNAPDVNRASGAAVGFAIASMIFVVLVVIVKLSMNTPPVDAARAAIISQALYQIHTNEFTQLNNPGWIDQPRGIVRLPIETAMQLAAQEWQNPAQARADLIARAQKSTAPAPKVANPFE